MDETEYQNIQDYQREQSPYYGIVPQGEEKHNVHTFLFNVAIAADTTKLGFLTAEEVGLARLPQRTLKDLWLFSSKLLNQPVYADYFANKAEILTSTSLSKDAKLLTLAVIQRREVQDVRRLQQVKNKGWFKKKQEISETELQPQQ